MYCTCKSPAGEVGQRCVICGEVVPQIVAVGANEPTCKTCGRLLTVPPLPIVNPKWTCPECGKG